MERLETTSGRDDSTKATQQSHSTSEPARSLLTDLPREIRDMVYDLVLGDHMVHIRSDMVLQESVSKDDKHEEHEDKDEDSEDEDEEDEEDQDEEDQDEEDQDEEDLDEDEDSEDEDEEDEYELEAQPLELLEISNEDRGPLYHSICGQEFLRPKDALLYRIRSSEAHGNRVSRVQSDVVATSYKHVRCYELSDPNFEYETIGDLGKGKEEGEEEEEEEEEEAEEAEEAGEAEDKPPAQLQLAFLRVNKQVYEEASIRLYRTRTFCFDDHATFAQFFSIKYNGIDPPTSTSGGTDLLTTKRNSIRSVHMRAKTALYLLQKIRWMQVLDAATVVLPELEEFRILFDLCYVGNERHVDRTFWQYSRHRNHFPLLKTAEVRVASDLCPVVTGDVMQGDLSQEVRDVVRAVPLLEAIVGHHMDVLFGAFLLDSVSVAKRNGIF